MHIIDILKKISQNRSRVFLNSVVFLICAVISFVGWNSYQKEMKDVRAKNAEAITLNYESSIIVKYGELKSTIETAKKTYPGIDVKTEEDQLNEIYSKILLDQYESVEKILIQAQLSLDKKITDAKKLAEDEAAKGTATGKITFEGAPVADAKVELMQEKTSLIAVQSQLDGTYTLKYAEGNYTLQVSKSGYSTKSQKITLKPKEVTTTDISLAKYTAQPVAPSPAPAVTSDGIYEKITVDTESNGSFTVHLMKFDTSEYEMIVDTAADGDCVTDCPVMSLSSYVSRNGGVAGIHGTYFCPTSYPACAGQTNSFYYKLYNGRLNIPINWGTGMGEDLPFFMIDKSGNAQYFNTWPSVQNMEIKSGISCRPNLVSGGQIVVTMDKLDSDKERYEKISHGFLGLKGQTIYAGIVTGATVLDSAAVAHALGLDYALNIDGGGTSAMYYNSSYKYGPGRDMPNAVVFRKR